MHCVNMGNLELRADTDYSLTSERYIRAIYYLSRHEDCNLLGAETSKRGYALCDNGVYYGIAVWTKVFLNYGLVYILTKRLARQH